METTRLIGIMSDIAEPVRPLPRPFMRTMIWALISLTYIALVVAVVSPRQDLTAALTEVRYLIEQFAALGAGLAAASAAFATTIPGYSRRAFLLPIVPLAVWLGSLGQGCIEDWMRFGLEGLSLQPDWVCFPSIIVAGAVPALVMIAMLRRGAPLFPHATTALGALAAAGLGNFGLRLFHAQDASLMVLVWQFGTVFVLAALAGLLGRYVLNWRLVAGYSLRFRPVCESGRVKGTFRRSGKGGFMWRIPGVVRLIALIGLFSGTTDMRLAPANPAGWAAEWPRTDFNKHSVALSEIKSGGPPKDGIPSIDSPRFERLVDGASSGWSANLADKEPVISLAIDGDARTYPLRVLIWHEIVNDTVAGKPVAVTYCPLCNAAPVFDRTVDGRVLDFGTTGKLRHSDLVMYDRQTESWWQQFTGDAIVGAMTGQRLRLIPSRLESFELFRQRFPNGLVLAPTNEKARNYGVNPYAGYDASGQLPFLYDGSLPQGIEPMERVVAVETAPGRHEAWSLVLLREKGVIERADLVLRWKPGRASALDKRTISAGRDVGNVTVHRHVNGLVVDVPYDVTFAFAFHAFRPNSPIHKVEVK